MATLTATVYDSAAEVAMGYPLEELQVAVGGGSLQTDAITTSGMEVKRVRLFTDTDCHVAFGDNPTATSANFPLGAENPEYVWVKAGDKIAVIAR